MKKLVVITGASSGFGKALAKKFNAAGYPLLLLARRVEKLTELNLSNTLCEKVDVSDYASFEAAVRKAEAIYGETDLLINNAGVMLLGDLVKQDLSEIKTTLDTNVVGVLNGMKIVEPNMKAAHHGTIVNVASIAGVNAYVNHAVYCASKFAVVGLSRASQAELAPYDVRVLCVCPGAVNTELLSHTSDAKIKENYVKWRETTGVENITPEDVAETIFFAYSLPQGVNLRELQITDTKQAN